MHIEQTVIVYLIIITVLIVNLVGAAAVLIKQTKQWYDEHITLIHRLNALENRLDECRGELRDHDYVYAESDLNHALADVHDIRQYIFDLHKSK